MDHAAGGITVMAGGKLCQEETEQDLTEWARGQEEAQGFATVLTDRDI